VKVTILRFGRNRSGEQLPLWTVLWDTDDQTVKLVDSAGSTLSDVTPTLFAPGTFHTIVVGWSDTGIPPLGVGEISLWVDGVQGGVSTFTGPIAGAGPLIIEADRHDGDAIHPNGVYRDIILTSRVSDALQTKLLETEA